MATIAFKDATTPKGNPNYLAGSGFVPGRTLNMYINGQFAGVQPTGPFGTTPYGTVGADVFVPGSIPGVAVRPVLAQDNTDPTDNATTTLTVS